MRLRWVFLWLVCALACVVLAAFVLSFFLNSMIRSRVQKAMNHELKGYHAQVAKAHFQLVDLTLTLHGVTIVQNANPKPPVGQIPFLQANLEWHDLFIGHLVGNFVIKNPTFHIDPAQLEKERTNKYSLRQEGWQDALQDIYPFKINRLRIVNARITYIPAANPNKPLYLEHFNLQAHNIRNILYPKNTYPSGIYVQSNMFGTGRFGFNGRANFLSTPFPGIRARYWMEHVPLGQLEPELKQMNITLQQGTFTSYGVLEYSPTIEKAHIYDAFINGVQIKYAHKSSTAQLETQRVREVKKGAEKLNNKPGLMLKIDNLKITDSSFAYTDDATDPPYNLSVARLNGGITNFSNHFTAGTAKAAFTGQFMGSGKSSISGTFRPETEGPDFNLDLKLLDVDLPLLNNLFRAYGDFEVYSGQLSVYSQVTVRRGEMTGYVKPLFGKVQVYNAQQEKNKGVFHQLYEMTVGAVSKLLKNPGTRKVATKVNVSGRLANPNLSTWQAIVEFLHNAFVKAILPGFSHEPRIKPPPPGP